MTYELAQRAKYEGDDWWSWAVWLEATARELKQVSSVEYHLHETFPQPIVTKTSREDKFVLRSSGWGTFTIRAIVYSSSGKVVAELQHELELEYPPERASMPKNSGKASSAPKKVEKKKGTQKAASQADDEPYLFFSYSSADVDAANEVKSVLSDHGVRVRDGKDVLTGSNVFDATERLISGAAGTVALLSDEGNRWVETELKLTRDRGKPVFALLEGRAGALASLKNAHSLPFDSFREAPQDALFALKEFLSLKKERREPTSRGRKVKARRGGEE